MVELDQFKAILNSYAKPLVEVRDSLDLANKEKRIEELERKIEEPGFWDKTELSQRIMKELRKMQDCVKEVRDLESSYEDINALIELTEEEEDREMIKEIQREI